MQCIVKPGVIKATFPHLHLGLGVESYVAVSYHAKSQALFPGQSSLIYNLSRLEIKVEQAGNNA